MNLLDLGLIVVLLLLFWRGYTRGLLQEVSTVIGFLAGLVVAAHYYLHLARLLASHLPQPTYNRLAAFFLLFIGVYWLIRLGGLLFRRLLVSLYLGPVDRWLGSVFALLKGAVILGFILSALSLVIPKDTKLLQESRLAPYVKGAYQQVLLLLPADFKEQLRQRIQRFQQDWSPYNQRQRGEAI